MVPGSSPLLCGKVSRDIRQELDKLSCDIRTKKLRWFSECFSVTNSVSSLSLSLMGLCLRLVESYSISDEKWKSFKTCKRLFFPSQPPGGSSNLWNLVSVINGQDDSLLPASYNKGVMHMKHLLKFKTVGSSFCTASLNIRLTGRNSSHFSVQNVFSNISTEDG